MKALLVVLSAAALAGPATAGAATVAVERVSNGAPFVATSPQVRYVASPGEANRVTFRATSVVSGASGVQITDPGAAITAGTGCTVAADGHSATCTYPTEGYPGVRADLGDGDDVLRYDTRGSSLPLVVSGGPGSDDLEGGPGNDILDGGGGGRDVIDGGGGRDTVTDGDTDADTDADVLSGGARDANALSSLDIVSYASHTRSVTIDLSKTTATQGAAGEGDTLTGFTSVTGGAGDDDLRADPNGYGGTFVGGAGDDRIRATRNADDLEGGPGDDVLKGLSNANGELQDSFFGGPGRDVMIGGTGTNGFTGGSGLDRYTCGGREDHVREPQAGELLRRGCELLSVGRNATLAGWRPYGTVIGRRLAFQPLGCSVAGQRRRPPCRGRLVLRERGGDHRLIGTKRFAAAYGGRLRGVRVRLTKLGGRLAHRRRGVLVTARTSGPSVPDVGWGYRLR